MPRTPIESWRERSLRVKRNDKLDQLRTIYKNYKGCLGDPTKEGRLLKILNSTQSAQNLSTAEELREMFTRLTEEDWVRSEIAKFDAQNFVVPNYSVTDSSEAIFNYREAFLSFLPQLAAKEMESLRMSDSIFPKSLRVIRAIDLLRGVANFRMCLRYVGLEPTNCPSNQVEAVDLDYLWNEYPAMLGGLHSDQTDTPPRLVAVADLFRTIFRPQRNEEIADLQSFIEVMDRIVKWANQHHCGKDWLVESLLFFVRQMKDFPELDLRNLMVECSPITGLDGSELQYRYRSWDPRMETPNEYRRRATESFAVRLEDYLREEYKRLNLSSRKVSTRKIDFGRIRWLVRWNVNKWTAHQIADEHAELSNKQISDKAVYRANASFANYGFPIRKHR